MLRLILYLIFIITYKQTVYSTEVDKYSKCSWANSSTPCVKIEKRLTNSSNLNEKFVNKYVITKEKIDEIGATDIVDVLKTVPGINLTQSGPSGQQTSVFLRGTGSNHTLVLGKRDGGSSRCTHQQRRAGKGPPVHETAHSRR